jgi:hypothetical protein
MTGTAIISPDGVYRYRLTRRIPCVLRWIKPVMFCMLNPSKATAEVDDPTIRRCIGFAKSWCCTELIVVNLFALRATDPKELLTHPSPVGPENDDHILRAAAETKPGGMIVAAWGTHGELYGRDAAVRVLLEQAGYEIFCLGTTKGGFPRHPLYVRSDMKTGRL